MNSEGKSRVSEVAASKMNWINKTKQGKVGEKGGTKYTQEIEGR